MKKLSLLFIFLLIINVARADTVYNRKSVRKLNKAYTLEVRQHLDGIGSVDLYHRAYLKNDKWKAETSTDGGKTFPSVMLFDGKDCVMYWDSMPYAIKYPDISSAKSNAGNPVEGLFYWDANGTLFNQNKAKIINNNAKMNGFNCRLIKIDDSMEACFSDSLNIAVYYKLKSVEPLTGMEQTNILNLIKVNNSDIPDSVFKLPQGLKVINYQ
ncbi:MAG: hypothetical protein NC408_03465 [Candidatus Gastranaerophilales bacterium]|nr:hypothetical protein [Candidatus Gastranaerophilales bacterium]MCM1073380.1 hypothetical protein [Bacteroides sp.]